MAEASNDRHPRVLVMAALYIARKTWRDGFRYSKAGVVTTDLLPLQASQRAMPRLGQLDREPLRISRRLFGLGQAAKACTSARAK
ncbi:hypothetical protein JOE48_000019 [Methylobacterium sp. PvR107]|nr:hypothetical protein [Methylobacterium sp. PvR107]